MWQTSCPLRAYGLKSIDQMGQVEQIYPINILLMSYLYWYMSTLPTAYWYCSFFFGPTKKKSLKSTSMAYGSWSKSVQLWSSHQWPPAFPSHPNNTWFAFALVLVVVAILTQGYCGRATRITRIWKAPKSIRTERSCLGCRNCAAEKQLLASSCSRGWSHCYLLRETYI